MKLLLMCVALLWTIVHCQIRTVIPTFAPVPSPDQNRFPQNARPGTFDRVITRSEDDSPCDEGFRCVPYYECAAPSDGNEANSFRLNGDSEKSCPDPLEACCATQNKVEKPDVMPFQRPGECGYRNIYGIGDRVSSSDSNITQFGEFPWMVAIIRKDLIDGKEGDIYQCGGSLIHPLVVLTAAHCVTKYPTNTIKIRVGEWDSQSTSELLPHQEREVAQVVAHEKFEAGSLFNNIALLFLTSAVDMAENVKTICLPPVGMQFDYENCIATGWGKNFYGPEGKYSVVMKMVDLPIIASGDCQERLRTTRLGKHFELNPSFICAGGQAGIDTCKGDGGSPLVCPIRGKSLQYQQAGIVSWGIGCGENNIPGVYASVSLFRNWIDDVLAEKGFNQQTFTPLNQ